MVLDWMLSHAPHLLVCISLLALAAYGALFVHDGSVDAEKSNGTQEIEPLPITRPALRVLSFTNPQVP